MWRKITLKLQKSMFIGLFYCVYTVCSVAFGAFSSSCFFNSSNLALSCSLACLSQSILVNPVPAGTSLPTITFSFKPSNLSVLPLIEASVRTLVVSWNEAAEMKELVCRDAFVIPNKTLSN